MCPKRRIKTKIGELLLEKGAITRQQLEEALSLQWTKYKGKLLGQILVEQGYVNEEEIYSALATQLGYPYIKIANCLIGQEVLTLIPRKTVEHFNIMPIDRIGNILTVAMINPLEEAPLEEIERFTGLKVKIFVTTHSELKEALVKNYGSERF